MQQNAFGRGNQDWNAGEQPDVGPGAKSASLKVLVIEDEENIVELIKLGLRYEGFQVKSVSDGLQGVLLHSASIPIWLF